MNKNTFMCLGVQGHYIYNLLSYNAEKTPRIYRNQMIKLMQGILITGEFGFTLLKKYKG